MSSREQLQKTFELIKIERQADLDYYRQKVLLRSLQQRTAEGVTWYPVKLKRDYIGTGERLIVEVERVTHLEQPHAFQSGKSVSFFSNAAGKPEKDHVNGVINYVRDHTMVITLNSDELPDWIDHTHLGVDVMFDEMSYREMEFALKEVIKAEEDRVAELREILLGNEKSGASESKGVTDSKLNVSQVQALKKIVGARYVGFIHGPPGTGKTTTLVHAIQHIVKYEKQVVQETPAYLNRSLPNRSFKLGSSNPKSVC